MKKILLVIALAGFALHVKAQQFQPKPLDTVKVKILVPDNKLYYPFKYQPLNLGFDYRPLVSQTSIEVSKEDHMPDAILSGNSKMPVARLDGKSFMPVKHADTDDIQVIRKSAMPGMPAFTTPGG